MSPPTAPKRKIALTGTTGDVGSKLLPLLQKADVDLKIVYRKPAQIAEAKSKGLNAALADLDGPVADIAKAFSGCDTLYLLVASTPRLQQQCFNAIDAAVEAGVKWIVKVSASDARETGTVPWARAHGAAGAYLKRKASENGIKWTILAPSGFMTAFIRAAKPVRKGFLPQTAWNGTVGWIDTADVAAVSAQLLQDGPKPFYVNQTHILTGPQLLSFPDVAKIYSRHIGHHVRYLHLPGPVYRRLLMSNGMNEWHARGLEAQFVEIIRPGDEGIEVSDAVERILGRPPTSVDEYIARNKKAFEGSDVLGTVIMAVGLVAGVFAIGGGMAAMVIRHIES